MTSIKLYHLTRIYTRGIEDISSIYHFSNIPPPRNHKIFTSTGLERITSTSELKPDQPNNLYTHYSSNAIYEAYYSCYSQG